MTTAGAFNPHPNVSEPSRVPQLEVTELQTGPDPVGSVIWMHGLGADGHDFEPLVPELVRPDERALRFVFPHAPVRPVTINNGYAMRAWYDIIGIDRRSREDEAGVRGSDAAVRALIRRENERGIPSDRIVLAGFSQGAAMALFSGTRYPEKLAGLMGLSGYMVLAPKFDAERTNANQTVPIFLAHGTQDPVVMLQLGEDTHQLLEATQYSVEWHTYPMPHSVCQEEVADIAEWLRRVL
jgi:phospholipase/carboxylesterase